MCYIIASFHLVTRNVAPVCETRCGLSEDCIFSSQWCDGTVDCPKGEDEMSCWVTIPCEKRCGSSVHCIFSSQWCDGTVNCPNGEDEMSCLRLYGADFQLQVYSTLKSTWLPVCADDWTDDYGRFACQDIGYNRQSYKGYNTLLFRFAPNGYFKLKTGLLTSKFYTGMEYSNSCLFGYVVSLRCIDCGVAYKSVTSRITGGSIASLGNWPWQVNLQHRKGEFCGGSIISPKWIVTAAHCPTASDWKVFSGTLTLPSYSDTSGLLVQTIFTHPVYKSYDNDIAIMKLQDEITFDNYTQPVCLPNYGMYWGADTTCWISGWGRTNEASSTSTYLRYAQVLVVDSNKCNYSNLHNGRITSSMLCAGYLSEVRDTCQGDNGGPLVTFTNARWWLVGDASWGFDCGQANIPGVYGNVTVFLEWIYLQMKSMLAYGEGPHRLAKLFLIEGFSFDRWIKILRIVRFEGFNRSIERKILRSIERTFSAKSFDFDIRSRRISIRGSNFE
ncbi:hypothetical protein XELAEV_18011406mg, partial [Xenopus laevis]